MDTTARAVASRMVRIVDEYMVSNNEYVSSSVRRERECEQLKRMSECTGILEEK